MSRAHQQYPQYPNEQHYQQYNDKHNYTYTQPDMYYGYQEPDLQKPLPQPQAQRHQQRYEPSSPPRPHSDEYGRSYDSYSYQNRHNHNHSYSYDSHSQADNRPRHVFGKSSYQDFNSFDNRSGHGSKLKSRWSSMFAEPQYKSRLSVAHIRDMLRSRKD